MKEKRGQISTEYLIVLGFIIFVVIGIMSLSFFYVSSIRDGLLMLEVTSFSNKVVSSAESVFYSGTPSRNTISVYIPEEVLLIEIIEDSLVVSVQTKSGIAKVAFPSNVPISGTLGSSGGYRKILIVAQETGVEINDI